MIPPAALRGLLIALHLVCGAASLAAQRPASPPPPDPSRAAPVVLGTDTVFQVYARLGPFSAAERAEGVRARLERLVRDPYSRDDTVRVVIGDVSTDVVVGDVVLATITEADAAAAGVPRTQIARRDAEAVARVLREQGFAARLRVIALGVLFALLVAVATVVVMRLINRVFPRLFAWVEQGRGTWIPTVRVQRVEVIPADRLADALVWLLRVFRVGMMALLLYLAVPAILSFFPWTRPYADQLFGFILTPFAAIWTALISYVDNVFMIGAIIVVTWYLLKLIRPIFVGLARGSITIAGFYPDWAIPTYKLVRTLVIILAVIATWPYIPGSSSPAFQGVGVFVGLLVSLGSASAIGNMIGGILLTYMRPFRVGDRVRIADTEGDVVEKSLLVTRIRTTKNVDITVPNSMVLGSHIINYSSSAKRQGLILHTTVTIGYDVPWRQVHQLLIGAARATPHVVPEPAPFVLQTSLDDFYVSYQLNAFTSEPNRMALTYSALHANIQDRFHQAGVEIMSPHYRAARDGNQTTIPAEHIPADYRAPAFRITGMEGKVPAPPE